MIDDDLKVQQVIAALEDDVFAECNHISVQTGWTINLDFDGQRRVFVDAPRDGTVVGVRLRYVNGKYNVTKVIYADD